MPDGTLIQWGRTIISDSGSLTQIGNSGIFYGNTNISLGYSFNNHNYTVYGSSKYDTGHNVPIGTLDETLNSFKAYVYDFYARPLNDGLYKVRWCAIGRWK